MTIIAIKTKAVLKHSEQNNQKEKEKDDIFILFFEFPALMNKYLGRKKVKKKKAEEGGVKDYSKLIIPSPGQNSKTHKIVN